MLQLVVLHKVNLRLYENKDALCSWVSAASNDTAISELWTEKGIGKEAVVAEFKLLLR